MKLDKKEMTGEKRLEEVVDRLEKIADGYDERAEILDHRLFLLEQVCNRIARLFLEKAMHEVIDEELARHKSLKRRGGGGFNIVDDGKGGLKAE